jgi:hypothetical protein
MITFLDCHYPFNFPPYLGIESLPGLNDFPQTDSYSRFTTEQISEEYCDDS